jgi:hypothetical protein
MTTSVKGDEAGASIAMPYDSLYRSDYFQNSFVLQSSQFTFANLVLIFINPVFYYAKYSG